MSSLSTPGSSLRRIRNAKMLLASIFLGILFATTLAAAVPITSDRWSGWPYNLEIDRLGKVPVEAARLRVLHTLYRAADGGD